MMPSIGVVLTTYKRNYIARQIEAVRNQSVKPSIITVWRNDDWSDMAFAERAGPQTAFVKASSNMGVWPRFLLAASLPVDYVCLFDDDTIPGVGWLQNCLNCVEQVDGLYATSGFKITKGESYSRRQAFGWGRPNLETTEVDVCGHCWFLRRDYVHRIYDFRMASMTAGEDMALSFAMQRCGLRSFIPPHPPSNTTLWGSTDGMRLGRDGNGISAKRAAKHDFQKEFTRFRSLGWRLLCDG